MACSCLSCTIGFYLHEYRSRFTNDMGTPIVNKSGCAWIANPLTDQIHLAFFPAKLRPEMRREGIASPGGSQIWGLVPIQTARYSVIVIKRQASDKKL